jgi:hypothetical protein
MKTRHASKMTSNPSLLSLWKLAACCTLALLLSTLQGHGQTVRTLLDSPEIPLGGYTHLNIEIDGDVSAEPSIPRVDGLSIRRAGTSSSTSIINGRVTRSTTLRFAITGEKLGTIRIPPIGIVVGSKTLQTEALTIQVVDSPSRQSGSQRTTAGSGELTAEDIRNIAFIELESDANQVFVGQKVPLRVKLYLNTQMRFNQITQTPTLEHPAILTPSLAGSTYTQTVEIVAPYRYDVIAWDTHFTPIQAGAIDLSSKLELTILTRARRQTSGFPDSFFDGDFFGSNFRSVPIVALSNTLSFEALPAPANPPTSYTGAIGRFTIDVEVNPKQVFQGDPVTLDIIIAGEGNFERVTHPGLSEQEGFRTYAPQVSLREEPGDVLSGAKTFKQAIIPNDANIDSIPPLTFTFLDPQSGNYLSVASQPLPIVIIPRGNTTAITTPTGATRPAGTAGTAAAGDGLVGVSLVLDKTQRDLRPLVAQISWLVLAGCIPLVLLALSLAAGRLRDHLSEDATRDYKLLLRNLEKTRKRVDAALRSRDPKGWILAAAEYTRLLVADHCGLQSRAVTSADLKSANLADAPTMKQVLLLAESLHYAGGSAPEITIEPLNQAIRMEWDRYLPRGPRSARL